MGFAHTDRQSSKYALHMVVGNPTIHPVAARLSARIQLLRSIVDAAKRFAFGQEVCPHLHKHTPHRVRQTLFASLKHLNVLTLGDTMQYMCPLYIYMRCAVNTNAEHAVSHTRLTHHIRLECLRLRFSFRKAPHVSEAYRGQTQIHNAHAQRQDVMVIIYSIGALRARNDVNGGRKVRLLELYTY